MNLDMLNQIKTGQGFIAALDQSGGSTPKALANYGIANDAYRNETEMFDLVHQMRTRVVTSPVFTSDKIIGAILFERTMLSNVNGKGTAEYLWQNKHIVPFLKVDDGLAELENGAQLMKPIANLDERLELARQHGVFGTKMRSVIHQFDKAGIASVIEQQFQIAKTICQTGLVPIIEPEVSISAEQKDEIEHYMKELIIQQLNSWPTGNLIMFKFTIPTTTNLYLSLYDFDAVVRIVALSGGYDVAEACAKLAQNNNMPASFSRALLQDLRAQQSDNEFNHALETAIDQIYQASIN